jgi:hypoxanthine-DNA glycosylase
MPFEHPFPPIYIERSKALVLGSFPSAASRAAEFYYAHPQNRFWKVIAYVCGREAPPESREERVRLLISFGIAIWDVAASCEADSSLDSSLRLLKVNDFAPIFQKADIQMVFANGAYAFSVYKKHCKELYNAPVIRLPSTSPANASYSLESLKEGWAEKIRPALGINGTK